MELYEELGIINEEMPRRQDNSNNSTLVKAKAFINDYVAGKYWYVSQIENIADINTIQDILQMSFYVPHLVAYYKNNKKDKYKINNLKALLSIFDCELFDKVNSLQYLYNAINQEKELVKAVPDLIRNKEATRAGCSDEEKDYHYLVAANKNKDAADFKYGENIKVDAKIYKNIDTACANANSDANVAHDARLLIVYLKDSSACRWRLLVKHSDGWQYWTYDDHKQVDSTLQNINELTEIIKCLPALKLWPAHLNK